jgi:putative ABC transport system permease protein
MMMVVATLLMAAREIRRNTLRSALTGLGIVIGVAAVIVMVTVGDAASRRVAGDIGQLGSNLLIVSAGSARKGPVSVSAPALTSADAAAIARDASAVAAAAPVVNRGALVVAGNRNTNTLVVGATAAYLPVRNYTVRRGRDFSAAEQQSAAPVCILGATVDRVLFPHQDAVGASVRVDRVACKVVGVLAGKGSAIVGGDQDDLVVMPLVAVQRRLTGSTDLTMIFVSAASERATVKARTQIEQLLRARRPGSPGQADDFSVQDLREISNTLGAVTGVLTTLLAAIAAVSLVVGGIGIMNIMLVSVTERTREIGIRLAVGALAGDVLRQFLIEAIALSTLGGAVGLGLGLAGSYALCNAMGLPFAIISWVIAVSLFFSIAVGVVFGYVPARRAARLDPIEALRHE